MNQELIDEIKFNLQNRDSLKSLFDSFKERGPITNVDPSLIELKYSTMDASYNDLALFLVKLLNDKYLSVEEANFLADIFKSMDLDNFYADSEELEELINNTEKQIDPNNLEESINTLKQNCKDKYELYILQRAAYSFDYMVDIE